MTEQAHEINIDSRMIYDECCFIGREQFAGLDDLLANWRRQWPEAGVLLLMPEAERSQIQVLQAGFKSAGLPLVGALFPSLIADTEFVSAGAYLIRFNVMPPFFLLGDLNGGVDSACSKMLKVIQPLLGSASKAIEKSLLFLIFDGLLPNIGSILNELWRSLHQQVRYAGVNAGSETFLPMPCLFDQHAIVENGVLGLLLSSSATALVEHAYPVSRTIMRATSVEGNRIDLIDGRPALEVYQDVIKAEYDVDLTRDNFYEYAVHYPFGMVGTLDVLVRIPVGFSDGGALYCVGEVPPHSVLRLIRAPDIGASNCIELLADALAATANASDTAPLLTFYCAGRRMHFGQEARNELGQLKSRLGRNGVLGALTLGEIDTMAEFGVPGFHNAAVVLLT